MDYNQCTGYIYDLGLLIKEKALEAKQAKDTPSRDERQEFILGRLMAFQEIISLMQQQAVAFGISLDEIGLADIDPEQTLL